MKKFLALALLLGTSVIFVPSIEAKTNNTLALNNSATPQINIRIGKQRRKRVVTRTRVVRNGRFTYRETVRTTYWPNGRVTTQVVNRVRTR